MNLPVTTGLVLHLESDAGVSQSGNTVTGWDDASSQNNDLNAAGNPQLSANATPTGEAAIELDGAGDKLERVLGLNSLPAGNQDRTVFFVVDYKDDNNTASGFAYGDDATNETFGLTIKKQGDLMVQGYGGANDLDSDVPGIPGGFLVQSAVLDGSDLTHYLNGAQIDSATRIYATDLERIVIGQQIGGGNFGEMDVAAVIVYDRALTETERGNVETYLQQKYIQSGNLTPTANPDTASPAIGGTVAIDVLDNDIDDAPLTGSMITITDGPDAGTINSIDPVTGVISYTHDGSGVLSDQITYTLTDGNGATSAPTTVDITVGGNLFALDDFADELVLNRGGMTNAESGFFLPISMAFLPDNRMLLISKDGEILIVDPETGAHDSYMQLNNIDAGQERGLLDIVLDPDFATNGHFYLYYTPNTPESARIARFTHQENAGGLSSTGNLGSESVIWQDTDGYLACCHYGSGLDFGPDGKIWLTTSDKFQTSTPGETTSGEGPKVKDDVPLDLTSSSGKIIRVNKDGSIPDGTDGWAANPFIDGPGGNDDSIWAYGLRNPFRAEWDFDYGYMYIGEVGGNQQAIAHDDIHLASLDQAGAFYGWPFYEGTPNTYVNDNNSTFDPNNFPQPDGDLADPGSGDLYSSPIWSLDHQGVSASLTGGEVYRGNMFPSEWDGVYFYGDYTRDYIRYLTLDATGTQVLGDFAFKPSAEIPGTTNELVSINVGNDGALYYLLISSGEVRRVIYEGNQAPDITTSDVTPQIGDAPLQVTFTAQVTDPDGDPMTYTLNFGDGTVFTDVAVPGSGNISVNHTYTVDGAYDVVFSVTDGTATSLGAPTSVAVGDVNDAPVIVNEDSDLDDTEQGVPVTFMANVTDADGDPMTYTWHFGDGSTASGTVPAGGIVTEVHSYTADGNYDAYLEVSDGEETVFSSDVPVLVGDPVEVPVTNGLVLLLQSDIKIGLGTGSTVTAWLDGSGNGNNLFAQGDPQLVTDQTPTGQNAIVFDGTDDLLERVNATDTIFNLPAGNADRTMFVVVDYAATNGVFAGASYGDNAQNEAFGVVASNDGELTVQGYGASNDFKSGVNGVAGGFQVQAVTLSGGTITHYRNGVQIDSDAHAFNTDVERLILGGEIGDLGEAALSLGAVLIYDRALNASEFAQVQDFLNAKYIANQAPDAQNDAFSVAEGGTLTGENVLDDNGNGEDTDANPGQTLSVDTTPVDDVDNGTLSLNADGTFTYTPDAGFSGTDSFTYRVRDDVDGTDTAVATITVTGGGGSGELVTAGLVGQYEADANVSLGAGSDVLGWLDGSGFGNDLVSQGNPQVVGNSTPTGQNAIVFDGTGDLLERVNATDSLTNLASGNTDRTLFFVVNYLNAQGVTAGLVYGDDQNNQAFGLTARNDGDLTVQGFGGANDFDSNVDGVGAGWMVQSVVLSGDTTFHYQDGSLIDSDGHVFATDLQRLIIGGEIGDLGQAQMEVAAALVYNRALTTQERQDVEAFLQTKYIGSGGGANTAPVAQDDAVSVAEDGTLNGNVLADNGNGVDSDGDGDPLSVNTTPIDDVDNGTLSLNANGTFTYDPDPGFTGTDSFVYEVSDGQGGTDQATVTITVNASGGGGLPTPVYDAPGDMSFNGTGATVLQLAHTPNLAVSEGAVAFSFSAADLNGSQGLFSKDAGGYAGGGNGLTIFLVGSQLRARFEDNNSAKLFKINGINANQDYEVVANFSASGVEIWLDGVLEGSDAQVTDWSSNTEWMQWGARGFNSSSGQPGFNAPFNGTISDKQIYGQALSPAQVAILAGGGGGGPGNTAPVAQDDAFTMTEDGTLSGGNVLADNGNGVDSDADGHTLTVATVPVVDVTDGTLTLNANGTFVYTPDANFNGTDSFTYQVNDGNGGTDTATVTITVDPDPDPPVAQDDAVTVVQDGTLNGDVLADNGSGADSDPDGDALSVATTPIDDVDNGTLSLNANGTFTYDPDPGFTGTDEFIYQVSDGNGGTDQATVTIDVTAPGSTPTPIFAQGGVLDFDGSAGDVINLAHTPTFEIAQGTIAFSFIDGNPNSRQGLFTKDAKPVGDDLAMLMRNGDFEVRFQDGSDTNSLKFLNPSANQEYEVAVTFGAGGVALWIDGALVDSNAGVSMDWTNNAEFLQIGGLGWGSPSGNGSFVKPFSGQMADVEIYDEVLDGAEIAALAASSSFDIA